MPSLRNIFNDLPKEPNSEHFLTIFESTGVKIERIVSHTHGNPRDFWYDQDHDEWVIVLKGEAILQFEGGKVEMKTGDYLFIPRHKKHRVDRTSEETVWLSVHVPAA